MNKDFLEKLQEIHKKHSSHFFKIMNQSFDVDKDLLKYNKIYLGYIDIMGYKNIIKQYGEDSPKELFEKIFNPLLSIKASFFHESYRTTLFSDTLIIESVDSEPVRFWNLIREIQIFRCSMIKNGYLLRGSVVYGNHFNEKDIWISPCLINAYNIENNISNVARIVISKEAYNNAKKDIRREKGKTFVSNIAIDLNQIEEDYDGNLILKFEPTNVEVKYLRYGNHINPKLIDRFIKSGNNELEKFKNGLLLALERAHENKERSKVVYLIKKWNTYCDSIVKKEELKKDYSIAID